jgi:hypothetical protein
VGKELVIRNHLKTNVRVAVILGFALAATLAMCSWPEFGDPLSYFNFADQRIILGIPNFMDVVSNAPWALIGFLGMRIVWREQAGPGQRFEEDWERLACGLLFLAIGSVAFGSAYFHLSRDPARLIYDRLPITLAAMSLFALIIGERITMRIGRIVLIPLVALGTGSVFYWNYTQTAGRPDLRWYILVQFFPLLAIPLMYCLSPARYSHTYLWTAALIAYVSAKLFEWLDRPIFAATSAISGHTLKHLAGALSTYLMFRVIQLRRPIR